MILVDTYSQMTDEAGGLEAKRMAGEAEFSGADAAANIRYASAAVLQGAAEVIDYGTAARFL